MYAATPRAAAKAATGKTAARPAPAVKPHIARKCACGGTCEECLVQRSPVSGAAWPHLATRSPEHIEVSAPDAAEEREADQAAERVMSGRASGVGPGTAHAASGQPGAGSASLPSPLTRALDNFERTGEPLTDAARGIFEPRFRHDFSDVRVHTDGGAADAARAIHARAFTTGNHIAFAPGQYSPQDRTGQQLLAHELAHVVQQSPTIRRAPDDATTAQTSPSEYPQAPVPPSDIKRIIGFLAQFPGMTIRQILVVDKNTLAIYDGSGTKQHSFTLNRPGGADISGYFVGNLSQGWSWVLEVSDGKYAFYQKTTDWRNQIDPDSDQGQALQRFDDELHIDSWFTDPKALERFHKALASGTLALAVLNLPDAKPTEVQEDTDGPKLSFTLPEWFKELRKKVEARIAEERQANKNNPQLPDKIFFYGSDKVQATRGAGAWTIEVEKGAREAYLTILEKEWTEASDKDAFAAGVTAQLLKKVQLILDETAINQEEQKEITEIDRSGAQKKGSKWAWAIRLKQQIEARLTALKQAEPDAKDFPHKLSVATVGEGDAERAHLRVWVYPESAAAEGAEPELIGGTLPTTLSEKDVPDDWVPPVRKAAAALRSGNVTTDPNATGSSDGQPGGDPTLLPPYPAHIHPRDMNPDRTTATTASNSFRMVVDTAAVHGSNLLHLTTLHMGMSIGYSWKVYPLPEPLKAKQASAQGDQLVEHSQEYVRSQGDALGDVKTSHDPDYDWDQSISMSDLGTGDFLLVSRASVAYPKDWNLKRASSVAAFPFSVLAAEDLAKRSALAELDAIARLKADLAAEQDADKKKQLEEQIRDLESREKTGTLELAQKDAEQTRKLLDAAGQLKKFIEDDRKRKIPFAGSAEHNPFLYRLKEFDKTKTLYSLYILVRQVFDFRYDDLYAIDEYIKLLEQQHKDLTQLAGRSKAISGNEKLRKDLPQYRAVAAVVKEDDGNLVPLILIAGHHKDSKPEAGKYKMLLFDVSFPSPKPDGMTYLGGESTSEEGAVKSAFIDFGEDNKYGNGKVFYRLPQTGYRDQVPSITTATEYLGYALAVLGVILLIAGTVMSFGTMAPAAGLGIAGLVTFLGIGAGVAGAILAAQNIRRRADKGTFALDADFALDVVSIIGAAVPFLGQIGKLTAMSRTVGAIERIVRIQRLEKLLLIYDAVELGGNIILVSAKVHEDIDAIKKLNLPKEQEDEMMQQVALDAMQQGAMLAFQSFTKAGDVHSHVKARVEKSRYNSFRSRGWIDAEGRPTDKAPPALREHATAPGKAAGRAAQGEQAWKETQVLDLGKAKTTDNHELTITERGRIIRCSAYCTDLRMKYRETLEQDPWVNKELYDLELRAQEAAKSGNKAEAQKVAADAAAFEGKLRELDNLRRHLFGYTEAEIDEAVSTMEPGRVTGGKKSGYKVDGTRIPKRQRRQMDGFDIMNEAELADIGKGGFKRALDRVHNVIGKKISEISVLSKHWDAARKDVLKGKNPTDYPRETVIAMYKDAQRKFWENVRKDPDAVDFLKKHGFELEGDRGAALATLGPRGKAKTERGNITDQERRVSLDHIDEKAQGDNWKRALDGDNLELMFQNANSQKEIVQVKFDMRTTVGE